MLSVAKAAAAAHHAKANGHAPREPGDDTDEVARPSWPSPADRARRLGVRGVRLPTGIETLDKATRGGLLTGRVVVFGGAPGAGKTTLGVQLGLELARAGVHVAILAADEEADGLLVRVGQALNLSRDDLEAGVDAAREFLAEQLETDFPTLMLVDQDEDGATLEALSAELKRRAAGRPSVLVVDSIQTARASGTDEASSPRERIDLVVGSIKRAAKVDGHLVIATSELARGAYRSRDAADRIDDLAAFKESGGIEYGVGTAIVLRSVADEADLVDVTMPKNRLGEKLSFRLELDRRRASLAEVPCPGDVGDDEGQRAEARVGRDERRIAAAEPRVLEAVLRSRLVSQRAVEDIVRGRRGDVRRALSRLLAMGRIVRAEDGRFVAVSPPADGGEA